MYGMFQGTKARRNMRKVSTFDLRLAEKIVQNNFEFVTLNKVISCISFNLFRDLILYLVVTIVLKFGHFGHKVWSSKTKVLLGVDDTLNNKNIGFSSYTNVPCHCTTGIIETQGKRTI